VFNAEEDKGECGPRGEQHVQGTAEGSLYISISNGVAVLFVLILSKASLIGMLYPKMREHPEAGS
jgi:hypothetical protein